MSNSSLFFASWYLKAAKPLLWGMGWNGVLHLSPDPVSSFFRLVWCAMMLFFFFSGGHSPVAFASFGRAAQFIFLSWP
jgi:hypothetical protein